MKKYYASILRSLGQTFQNFRSFGGEGGSLDSPSWKMASSKPLKAVFLLLLLTLVALLASCGGGTSGTGGTGSTTLQGTVVDPIEHPLSGLMVSVLETGDQTVTNEAGHFEFRSELLESTTLLVEGGETQASAKLQDASSAAQEVDVVLEFDSQAQTLKVRSEEIVLRPTPTPRPRATRTARATITVEATSTPTAIPVEPTPSIPPPPIVEPTTEPAPTVETPATPTPSPSPTVEEVTPTIIAATPSPLPTRIRAVASLSGNITGPKQLLSQSRISLSGGAKGGGVVTSRGSREGNFKFRGVTTGEETLLTLRTMKFKNLTVSLGTLPLEPSNISLGLAVVAEKKKPGSSYRLILRSLNINSGNEVRTTSN